MGEEMIGSLRRVALREVWPHEAQDFTPWLAENIDVLNNAIDLSLSIIEREQAAGDFSVDLVAEDESGNPVIIENQLERSNHDHLGKLITYLTAIGAKAAIWIVADPRPEHISAISWLNESSSASFYLLKLEAVRIEDSLPAPLLTLIVGSSEDSQEVDDTKKELKERHVLRRRFWASLLGRAKDKTKLHSNRSAVDGNYIRTGTGTNGLGLSYVIQQHTSDIELYIDRGRDADSETEELFDTLKESKEDIEDVFGEPLEWQRLEGQRSCRIGKQLSLGGYRDEEKWQEIQDTMIDGMIRLEKAFRPHIERLPV